MTLHKRQIGLSLYETVFQVFHELRVSAHGVVIETDVRATLTEHTLQLDGFVRCSTCLYSLVWIELSTALAADHEVAVLFSP